MTIKNTVFSGMLLLTIAFSGFSCNAGRVNDLVKKVKQNKAITSLSTASLLLLMLNGYQFMASKNPKQVNTFIKDTLNLTAGLDNDEKKSSKVDLQVKDKALVITHSYSIKTDNNEFKNIIKAFKVNVELGLELPLKL